MTEETTKVKIGKINSANFAVQSVDAEDDTYTVKVNVNVNSTSDVTDFNGEVVTISDGARVAYISGNPSNVNFNFYGLGKTEVCEVSAVVYDFLDDVKEYVKNNNLFN